jgi:hypothetical protein
MKSLLSHNLIPRKSRNTRFGDFFIPHIPPQMYAYLGQNRPSNEFLLEKGIKYHPLKYLIFAFCNFCPQQQPKVTNLKRVLTRGIFLLKLKHEKY